MGERLQSPIPMWRVQYQLLGGHRRLTLISLIYATLVIAGVLGLRRLWYSEPLSIVLPWLLNGLCGIQILIVVLGGCSAVYRATLRDYETRMIESHRLTPMSNITVVLGYLFGSTVQTVALFLINCAVGAVMTAMGGFPLGDWFYGNLLLLSGAIMLWAMFVFSGMRLAKPINPGPVLLGIALFSMGLLIVPGGGLMLGAYAVLLAFWTITGMVAVTGPAVIIVASISVFLTCFWLFVAAAKYRRPDLPALNASKGLFLLVFWLVIAIGGIVAFDLVTRRSMPAFHDDELTLIQWIATMTGSLIMASIALSSAVSCRLLVIRGASPRGWSDRVPDWAVVMLAVLLIGLLSATIGITVWPDLVVPGSVGFFEGASEYVRAWAITLGACALALLSVRGALVFAHSALKSPGLLVGLFVLFTWAGPPLGDYIRAELFRAPRDPFTVSWLLGCSPVGTIVCVWSPPVEVPLWPGLLVQLLIAAFCTLVARRVWVSARTQR